MTLEQLILVLRMFLKATPQSIAVNISWPRQEGEGRFKTPTALQFDEDYSNNTSWDIRHW
ncbi:5873_t:CDS:2 [Funneliformis geosporum]|nr:5873_t:CDS:2 [Funneliformis geosporum]